METVSTRLNTETIDLFGRVLNETRSDIIRELIEAGKKEKAVELYKNKKVSLGLGSKLADITLSEFIDLLRQHNVNLNLEKEDIEKAIITARKVF